MVVSLEVGLAEEDLVVDNLVASQEEDLEEGSQEEDLEEGSQEEDNRAVVSLAADLEAGQEEDPVVDNLEAGQEEDNRAVVSLAADLEVDSQAVESPAHIIPVPRGSADIAAIKKIMLVCKIAVYPASA